MAHPQTPQQPPPDDGRRFLNMSGGVLMAVVTGLIVLFCVTPVLCCFLAQIGGATRQ